MPPPLQEDDFSGVNTIVIDDPLSNLIDCVLIEIEEDKG